MKYALATAITLALCGPAAAKHSHHVRYHHHWHHHRHVVVAGNMAEGLGHGLVHMLESAGRNVAAARARGLPWCGAFMADLLHVTGRLARELWVAANWRHYGAAASGPAPGVIVVWRHHVGIIRGRGARGWIVESGNDGHAVRRRERSVAGAIAFRRPA